MEMRLLFDVLGWIGTVSLLSAYWLVSTNRVGGTSRFYQTLNVIGGGGLLANTFYNRAYPAAALNLAWLSIGVTAYIRVVVRQRAQRASGRAEGASRRRPRPRRPPGRER